MRYDTPINDVSKKCACGETYTLNHCLSCKKGGFIHIRHNVIRDSIHEMLGEVCKDVRKEPALQPVNGLVLPPGTNLTDGARSDVSALSFWSPLKRAFFDVRVFNPLAPTNWSKDIPQMHTHHEELKKREYNARIIEVEKGSFTPLVLSCSGGMSIETHNFVKKLAEKLCAKKQEQYSRMVYFIRMRLRFDLLKSCIISLRGERFRYNTEAVANLEYNLMQVT